MCACVYVCMCVYVFLVYVCGCVCVYVCCVFVCVYMQVSGPITSWEIDGETVETVADFIFLGSKITADGDCSHEIKRRLLLRRKVMTNLDSMFANKGSSSQGYGFFLWSCMDVRVGL